MSINLQQGVIIKISLLSYYYNSVNLFIFILVVMGTSKFTSLLPFLGAKGIKGFTEKGEGNTGIKNCVQHYQKLCPACIYVHPKKGTMSTQENKNICVFEKRQGCRPVKPWVTVQQEASV